MLTHTTHGDAMDNEMTEIDACCDFCAENGIDKDATAETIVCGMWVNVCDAHLYRVNSRKALRRGSTFDAVPAVSRLTGI